MSNDKQSRKSSKVSTPKVSTPEPESAKVSALEPPPEEGNPLVILFWMVAVVVGMLAYGFFSK